MANKLEILIEGNDQASDDLKRIQGNMDGLSKTARNMGLAMVAAGGAMLAGFGMAMKAAADEEAGIKRLDIAMRNVGLSYDSVEDSLESWIDTMQQKTAIADSEQRDSLASLVRMTGNLTEAQDLLVLAMDIAVGTGRDLESANTLIMYAMSGNWGMLERYIPAIKEAADEEEKWILLRRLFAGQAEAFGETMAGQMQLMKNNLGDLKEAIGGFVIEAVAPAVKSLNDFIQSLKDTSPVVMKLATQIGMGVAGALTLTGGFLIFLSQVPKIIAGFKAIRAMMVAANISALALIATLALLAAGLAIVGFGLYAMWKNAQAQELNIKLSEEYQRALEGEHEGYVQALKDKEALTGVMTEEAAAYIEGVEAMKAYELQLGAASQATNQLIDEKKELIRLMWEEAEAAGFSALKRAMPEGPLTEAQFKFWKREMLYLEDMAEYQHGGVVEQTGPAFLHKGETVVPAGAHITLPINLDGQEIARYVIEIAGNQARLVGVM